MNDTELWIEEARKFLKAAGRGECATLADRLQGHMLRIDLQQIQTDLGCGAECAQCSWGSLGGYPLPSEPCRLLALAQAIEELQVRAAQAVSARQEAAKLLQLLESLPSPRK